MDIKEYLKNLKVSSKSDDIPGTVEAYLDELCPSCGKKMKIMKPCCNSPKRIKICGACGFKVYLD